MSIPWWQRITFPASDIGNLYNEDNRELSEKYGNFGAPFFKVEISDKDGSLMFSEEAFNEGRDIGGWDLNGIIVNDVSWEEDIEGADALNLTINNPLNTLQKSLLFQTGNQIDLWMGYDGRRPFYMGRGIIVEVAPEFNTGQMSTIKVTCYDISYFMMEEGRAEIVPEGSAWWERQAVSTGSPSLSVRSGQQSPSNSASLQRNTDNAAEDIRRAESDTENIGGTSSTNIDDPSMDLQSYMGSFDPGQTSNPTGHVVTADEEMADMLDHFPMIATEDELVGHQTGEPLAENIPPSRARMGWQRQRFARRSRRAGKVWSGKTDSEIVEAIYYSYGIVPYIEATNERRRTSTRRNAPREDEELTYHNAVPDTLDEVEISEVERTNTLAEDQNEPIRRSYTSNDPTLDRSMRPIQGATIRVPSGNATVSGGQNYTAWTADADFQELLEVYPDSFDVAQEFEEAIGITQLGNSSTTPSQAPQRQFESRKVTQKAGTTDWEFIKKLGEQHGFICFTFYHYPSSRWIGYWGPQENVPQYIEHTFEYDEEDRGTLASVRPTVSAKNQSSEIDLIYVDPRNGKENRLRVSMDGVNEYSAEMRGEYGSGEVQDPVGRGPEVVLMVHGQRVRVQADRRFQSADDARRWLMAYWIAHAEEYYIIEGKTVIGIPEVRAREFHYVMGLQGYEGRFFFTQARHNMQPNGIYATTFTGRAVVGWRPDTGDEADLMTVDAVDLGTRTSGSEDVEPPPLVE